MSNNNIVDIDSKFVIEEMYCLFIFKCQESNNEGNDVRLEKRNLNVSNDNEDLLENGYNPGQASKKLFSQ